MKQELIEAIKATIVPNDEKAITAESLANLLIEMVEAMGEGGSAGAGQVVFYMGMPNEDMTEYVLTPEQKAHNAEMFQIVSNSPVSLAASVDWTGYVMANATLEGIDPNGLKANVSASQTCFYPKHIAELEGFSDAMVIIDSILSMIVFSDGSVLIAD